MKKIVSILLACTILFTLMGCGENSNKHVGEVKTPSGSIAQKGREYTEVVDDFKSKGFKNVKTEKIEDLITGWITKDGEVEEVSVNGSVDYSPDEWTSADAEVIIKYHTFKKEDAKSTSESSAKDKAKSTADFTVNDDTKSTTESIAETDSKGEEKTAEILTESNCKDLKQILNTKDEFDPCIKEFAQNYAGRTIEFDGNTADVQQHGDYKTRFDYLIYAGDYSKTDALGPSFQISDVNYSDLHLTGDNVPDTFSEGLNIHIVAMVGEYNETSGLFQLKPVSIKMR